MTAFLLKKNHSNQSINRFTHSSVVVFAFPGVLASKKISTRFIVGGSFASDTNGSFFSSVTSKVAWTQSQSLSLPPSPSRVPSDNSNQQKGDEL
mmetsp:Transcript_13185/g.19398  ORF Transcript_13185/g.19398 Transcript_13185/m.19398 type:complete len:94 (+) Transcript_13185:263-544(+)